MNPVSFDIAFYSAALINLTSAVMLAGIAPATFLRTAMLVYAAGLGLIGFSLLTVALRVWLGLEGEDWLLTNATSLISAACLIIALHLVFERKPPLLAMGIAGSILIVLLAWFDGDPERRPVRNLINVGAMMTSMFWRAGLALKHHRRDERGPAIAMAIFLIINGSTMLVAITWAVFGKADNTAVGYAAISGAIISIPVLVTLLMIVNRRSQAHLRALADTDGLSGALNRRAFFEQAASRSTGTIAMLDFDRFKAINDKHGHLAGDQVLSSGIKALQQALGEEAMLGRYGGEEFIFCLPLGAKTGAYIEQLRSTVNQAASRTLGERVTVSIGYAQRLPSESFTETIARADTALYRAKAEGRDRSVSADPEVSSTNPNT
jgi:diguanylate cyclase (GGDEF)-like protein